MALWFPELLNVNESRIFLRNQMHLGGETFSGIKKALNDFIKSKYAKCYYMQNL
jgi:hypothetical protein